MNRGDTPIAFAYEIYPGNSNSTSFNEIVVMVRIDEGLLGDGSEVLKFELIPNYVDMDDN